ncbi:hypothetical protein IFM89_015750 [Coptis chinensis]|uniref:F-box domain-containing protein n=1 Tax=Coptis chinensis TaxID=261450 RepID=A0A835I2M5_9MAGN|nr:hypothetical protein IFM89_015750 [Coptis chinensis]
MSNSTALLRILLCKVEILHGHSRGGLINIWFKFEDEIKPKLKHTGAGILSMANNLYPPRRCPLHARQAEGDKLSCLPVELNHMITKRVPVRDIVRTSALSRSWSPLEKLKLISCDGFNRLKLCAPNLRLFHICGYSVMINFSNTTKLESVHMELLSSGVWGLFPWKGRALEDVLGGLIYAEKLNVLNHFMKVSGSIYRI